MSAQDNGGSAFPVADIRSAEPRTTDELRQMARGMTMRDFFAAKAPPYTDTWIQRYCRDVGYMSDAKCMADWAYEYADAMLKARQA